MTYTIIKGTGDYDGETVQVRKDGNDLELHTLDSNAPGIQVYLPADKAREVRDAIDKVMGFNVVPAPKAAPKGAQKYRGNGIHKWEEVTNDHKGAGHTYRLRVPGGFIYRTVSYSRPGSELVKAQSTVFVPLPPAVGYAV